MTEETETEEISLAWHEYTRAAKEGNAEALVLALSDARQARNDAIADAKIAYAKATREPIARHGELLRRAEQSRNRLYAELAEMRRQGAVTPSQVERLEVEIEMRFNERTDAAEHQYRAALDPELAKLAETTARVLDVYKAEAFEARRLVEENFWFDWVPQDSPVRAMIEAAYA